MVTFTMLILPVLATMVWWGQGAAPVSAVADPLAAFQEKLRKANSVEFDEACYAGSYAVDMTYREKQRRYGATSYPIHVQLAKPNMALIRMDYETIVADGKTVRYFDPQKRVWAEEKQEKGTLEELFREPDLAIWGAFFDLPADGARGIKRLGRFSSHQQIVDKYSFVVDGQNGIGEFRADGMITSLDFRWAPFTSSEEASFTISKAVLEPEAASSPFSLPPPASFTKVDMNHYRFGYGMLTLKDFHISERTHRLLVIEFTDGVERHDLDEDEPLQDGNHRLCPYFFVTASEALTEMANSFVYAEVGTNDGTLIFGSIPMSELYNRYQLSRYPALVVAEPDGRMLGKLEGAVGSAAAVEFLRKFAKPSTSKSVTGD